MKRTIRLLLYRFYLIIRYPFDLFKGDSVHYTAQLNCGILNRSTVGKYTYIEANTVINSAKIGNYTSIAPGVQIGGMEHAINWYAMSTTLSNRHTSGRKTIIGNNVWIAANAIIRQGVRIGDGSVIGAGAFVNKDVPTNTIVAGVPAKKFVID